MCLNYGWGTVWGTCVYIMAGGRGGGAVLCVMAGEI